MGITCTTLKSIRAGTVLGTTSTEDKLPLDATGVEVRFDVRLYTNGSVYVRFNNSSSTGAVTLYRSVDGVNAALLETTQVLTISNPMSATLDLTGIAYLHARVTTAVSSEWCEVRVLAKVVQ